MVESITKPVRRLVAQGLALWRLNPEVIVPEAPVTGLRTGSDRLGAASRMGRLRRSPVGPVVTAARLAGVLLMGGLSGCGQFFAKTTPTNPTTPTSTGDYLYVANSNTTLNTVAGFALSTAGTLSATTSSPYTLNQTPSALAVTPANTFLYAGSVLGDIDVYSIGSTGELTLASGGGATVPALTAMAVDSTGQWLLVVQDGDGAPVITVFSINATTGALSTVATAPSVTLDAGSSGSLLMVPGTTLVYATLGQGVDALTFDSGTGLLTKLSVMLPPLSTADSDVGLAANSTGSILFVTETGQSVVRSLTINADGTLAQIAATPTGLGPGAVLVDSTDAYVYVANRTDGTISAFALSSTAAMTPITGSPFATGARPLGMVEDNTGTYLSVVCSGGTPDLQVFKISTTIPGALASTSTASTGSVSPAVASAIAATH